MVRPAGTGRRLFVGLLLILSLTVLCHGCHGDEDHELLSPVARVVPVPP